MTLSQKGSKERSQGENDRGRIRWRKETLFIFCDICNQHIKRSKGKCDGVIGQRLPWKKVEEEFHKATNLSWDKTKLKNKFDWMRTRWSLWKQLKGKETGIRWDNDKRTIAASEEWWTLKIKENINFKTFKEEGLEPELECKLDQLFGCLARGEVTFCPVVDPPQGQREVEEINTLDRYNTHHQLSGYRDHESIDETSGLNNCEKVRTEPTRTPQATYDEGSERRRCKRVLESNSSQSNKSGRTDSAKRVGRSVTMYERLDDMMQLIQEEQSATIEMNRSIAKILDTMNIGASQSTSASTSHHDVTNALEKLFTLPGLETGTPEFYFACMLIEDPQRRLIFFGLPDDTKRVEYIKFMYEYNKHKKH